LQGPSTLNFICEVKELLPHTTLFAQLSLLGLFVISTKIGFQKAKQFTIEDTIVQPLVIGNLSLFMQQDLKQGWIMYDPFIS
jgi:hypothetical protein